MTDVFISYANQDRARAQMLAEALQECGLAVWWDREIVAGQTYDEVIEHELDTAKSVVVLWSNHSIVSEWVKNEAAEAVQRGTLVPARIDAVKVPLEFRRKQTVDLIDWNGDPKHTGLLALCRGISATVAKELPSQPAVRPSSETTLPVASPETAPPGKSSTRDKPGSRRLVFLWTGAGLLLLAVLGLWYWDAFHRAHTDYYANVILRWGKPEGVGPLTDEQVRHRSVTLAFTKRGRQGLVKEIRAVNSQGAYPPEFAYVTPSSLVALNPLAGGDSEILNLSRITFAYDAKNETLKQSAYNRADRLLYELHYVQPGVAEYKVGPFAQAVRESGITHIKFVRAETGPDAGLNKEVVFLDSSGARPDRDGEYGYRLTFSPLGRPVEFIPLGADGEPAPNRVGIAKIVAEYDSQGNFTRSLNLGPQGQLISSSNGIAELKMRYDQHGNVTGIAFFGPDGQPITHGRFRAAERTLAYDDRGNVVETTFFGPDRKPVRALLGFAKQKVVWLEKGGTLETFFGPDDKPIPVWGGSVIKLRGTYDKRGFIVEAAGFDENDRPARGKDGCAAKAMARDKQGNVAEETCFDEDRQPVRSTEGYARRKAVYDEQGRRIESSYFDPRGHPERYEERYVKTRSKYNSQGNKVEEAYFDAGDRPSKTQNGYAMITYGYDLHGKMTEVSYFDETGRPALRKGGYAKIVRAYDGRGNMVQETYFDTDGKRSRTDAGCAKREYAYDERGLQIESMCHDEHDRPTLNKDGCAAVRAKYNDKGVQIEWACFGLDGLPAAHKYGWAKLRRTFDAQGNVSRWDYFDVNDRLAPSIYGYATIRYFYDEMGRETKREFFDANGALVSTHVGIDKVEPDTKSERSGLRVGDLILAYDGQEVPDVRVFNELELMRGERPRQITVQREGRILTLEVTAGRLRGLTLVERSASLLAHGAKEVSVQQQSRRF
jgi:YD repeat-containing protein